MYTPRPPPPPRAVSAVTRSHQGVFNNFFAQWNRVPVAQLSMVWPPAAAICDLLLFGGLGKNFCGPVRGPKRAINTKKWNSPVLGPFWAKRPLTKFDCMLNADPMNPVWGPTCPRDPRHSRLGGRAGGHFVGWGPVLSVWALPQHHLRVFGNFLAHWNRVRAAQLSYSEREYPHGARTASNILVAAQKMADLDLPHESQNKCVPRGVSKVCPISPCILR